ncbi:hypothetical protein HPB47_024269 [Ixodes persulcatus]|uniref:Uncharacterized protein n=1 Tax=Ixodes persulcatus TaxID=34615 RepID=A0AC60Q4U9_IXOPE|nr:hypothetical protein HPB47_024269 [Ixodes persulcatus]
MASSLESTVTKFEPEFYVSAHDMERKLNIRRLGAAAKVTSRRSVPGATVPGRRLRNGGLHARPPVSPL